MVRLSPGAAVLRLEGVHRRYQVAGGEVRAVDGVDLEVPARGIVTLVGASGCGKTTLIRLAAGLERPDAGRVWSRAEVRLGVVFQEPRLLRSLTVEGNVLLGLGPGKAGRAGRERAREVLDLLGLDGFRRAYPDQLSGGLAQRVSLGRALVRDPDLLLMDEPFSALDVPLRRRLQDELLAILRLRAIGVVFVTHDLAEAIYLGDRILVMRRGRVVQDAPVALERPRDLRSEPVHRLQDALARLLDDGGPAPLPAGHDHHPEEPLP